MPENEILVIGTSLKGEVDVPQKAVQTFDEEDIAAYGVSSIGELIDAIAPQTGSGRGRGNGRPVILLSGQRISSFSRDAPDPARGDPADANPARGSGPALRLSAEPAGGEHHSQGQVFPPSPPMANTTSRRAAAIPITKPRPGCSASTGQAARTCPPRSPKVRC
ncbi:hypothetical protein ACFSTD_11545 [Novosphingobium colocasiae]